MEGTGEKYLIVKELSPNSKEFCHLGIQCPLRKPGEEELRLRTQGMAPGAEGDRVRGWWPSPQVEI